MMCVGAIACQSTTMLVQCSNVTVSVKKFTCASVRLEWSLDQLGRHISIVIIIIIIIIIMCLICISAALQLCSRVVTSCAVLLRPDNITVMVDWASKSFFFTDSESFPSIHTFVPAVGYRGRRNLGPSLLEFRAIKKFLFFKPGE